MGERKGWAKGGEGEGEEGLSSKVTRKEWNSQTFISQLSSLHVTDMREEEGDHNASENGQPGIEPQNSSIT